MIPSSLTVTGSCSSQPATVKSPPRATGRNPSMQTSRTQSRRDAPSAYRRWRSPWLLPRRDFQVAPVRRSNTIPTGAVLKPCPSVPMPRPVRRSRSAATRLSGGEAAQQQMDCLTKQSQFPLKTKDLSRNKPKQSQITNQNLLCNSLIPGTIGRFFANRLTERAQNTWLDDHRRQPKGANSSFERPPTPHGRGVRPA
jgi:hypothetical protein